MGAPKEVLDEHLGHAHRQLAEVEAYMQRRAALVKQTLLKFPEQAPIVQHFRHEVRGAQWLCNIAVHTDRIQCSAVYYWLHGRGKRGVREALHAIQPRRQQRSLYFDTHFFMRWGLRTEDPRVKLTNMQGFLRQYPALRMFSTGRFKHGRAALAAAVDQGLVHGALHSRWLISCDTFLSFDEMHADEHRLWEALRTRDHTQG